MSSFTDRVRVLCFALLGSVFNLSLNAQRGFFFLKRSLDFCKVHLIVWGKQKQPAPFTPCPHKASLTFRFIGFDYLLGSTQSRGAGEQDGPLCALNEGDENLGARRVPRFEVVRLVHHHHGELLPAESLHQEACVCGEEAVTQDGHLTAADPPAEYKNNHSSTVVSKVAKAKLR